jgi:ABC-type Mn2+/Zn2+ transport system ATPase subunit
MHVYYALLHCCCWSSGKSSLLRALAGLWGAGKGKVTRPPPDEIFFLPQRPYCTLGKQQLRINSFASLLLYCIELFVAQRQLYFAAIALHIGMCYEVHNSTISSVVVGSSRRVLSMRSILHGVVYDC